MYCSVSILFLIALSSGLAADVDYNNEAEEQIVQFFSRWRNGDSSPFSLPRLDLIKIPATNGSYAGKGIKITYSTNEALMRGVNNFTVEALNVSLPFMFASGSLKIPAITLSTDHYTIQGKAFYVYTLKGEGKLLAILKDVNLYFSLRLNGNGSKLKVAEMLLDFTIGSIEANLENSSWPINKLLNQEGVGILNRYHDDIVEAAQARLIDQLDKYLMKVSPVDLLDQIRT